MLIERRERQIIPLNIARFVLLLVAIRSGSHGADHLQRMAVDECCDGFDGVSLSELRKVEIEMPVELGAGGVRFRAKFATETGPLGRWWGERHCEGGRKECCEGGVEGWWWTKAVTWVVVVVVGDGGGGGGKAWRWDPAISAENGDGNATADGMANGDRGRWKE